VEREGEEKENNERKEGYYISTVRPPTHSKLWLVIDILYIISKRYVWTVAKYGCYLPAVQYPGGTVLELFC
jgi:hypothetical protein